MLVGVCMPICIGIAWTSGFFFGSNNKFCLAMATEGFDVCLLCVMPIIWASPVESFQHFFLSFQIEMYLLSILVEPAINFLAIYTMLISLQTGNTIDVVIVVTCVAHAQMFVDFAWNDGATPLVIILAPSQISQLDTWCMVKFSIQEGSSFRCPSLGFAAGGCLEALAVVRFALGYPLEASFTLFLGSILLALRPAPVSKT